MKTLITILSYLFISLLYLGCGGGGGGGGGDDGAPEPEQTAIVSGALIIPPSHTVEVEPNDTVEDAQPVTRVTQISGEASAGDSGFEPSQLAGVTFQDLYLLEADEAVRIVLTIAADDPRTNNLDLLLMTPTGEDILETSKELVAVEDLDTEGAGSFLVGVRASSGGSAYLLSFEPLGILAQQPTEVPSEADFVPGEILVKLKSGPAPSVKARTILTSRYAIKPLKRFPGGVALMRLDEAPSGSESSTPLMASPKTSREATLERIRHLRRDPTVLYAEPNYIRYPQQVPSDEFYDLQWHYRLISLPEAWDVAVGDNQITVAVLDTGILPEHPDLEGRIVPGFDFISDPIIANDGDGIDPDFTDAGDDPAKSSSSFHGTHVAGIVGAATDNQEGVAGTTWLGGVMPLRVLGAGGGTVADIAQAILFAAGLENDSGTLPNRRADVINMSFGSPGFSQTVDDAVQAARAAGVTIVAAAGNDNDSVPFYPASYNSVISVSAVDLNAQKAPYSNFGPQIDLGAPGGDFSRDLNGDGHPDGVLSTIGNDSGDYFYRFIAGTSMAAPHVAGTVALMKSIYPQLTPADVDLLIAGDHPNTLIQIVRDLAPGGRDDLFGHGLIDARLAVQAAESLADGEDTGISGPILSLSTDIIDFQDFLTTTTFEITNGGTGTLAIENISENTDWLTVSPAAGTAPLTVTLTVDRRDLAEGAYQALVTVDSDAVKGDPSRSVEVAMTVGDVILGNVGSTFVLAIDHATMDTMASTQTDFGEGYFFTLPALDPGTYLITAGTDRDEDGTICETEDACGTYPELITVGAGEEVGPLEFPVGESIAPQSFSIFGRAVP